MGKFDRHGRIACRLTALLLCVALNLLALFPQIQNGLSFLLPGFHVLGFHLLKLRFQTLLLVHLVWVRIHILLPFQINGGLLT